jgi:hypothetical protein
MQIDTDHLHYWMCAIRDSRDPKQTLEAFWRGQIDSKIWLVDKLADKMFEPVTIDIYGGWVGTLASLLFQSEIEIIKINSIDIDPECKSIAEMMNKGEHINGKFEAVCEDMVNVPSQADVVINTSCEHISQEQYDQWLDVIDPGSLLVLQSNNYDIPEHIRICHNMEEFEKQSHIRVIWRGEFQTQLYTRYMVIGRRNV